MPVVFSRGYLVLVGQKFNTVHCHASGISVQPTWPSVYSAKCHRISSCACSLVFSQRLKEPPMHILGATSLCFSLFAGAMSCKCTLPQQPWTLISACSAQWDCSFLFGLLFPVLPPDTMWTSSHVLHCLQDHSLALSAQYLKAVGSHLAQPYGQS